MSGHDPRELAEASHTSWWLMTACGVALVVIALVVTSAAGRRSSERVRSQLIDA